MRFFIDLSYNGKAYHGWQIQPNAISVQEVMETALSTLSGQKVSIVGAGRTDTGVHARQMVAHFDLDNEIDTLQLAYRINAFLPEDISVREIYPVKDEAHARFDAEQREYKYYMHQLKDPFLTDTSYYFKPELNHDLMNEAASHLLNHRNFKCFSRSNTDVKTYNCDVRSASWKKEGIQLVFTISADRFLRNMVRAVVGTLIEIGQGKMSMEEFKTVLKSENRSMAGPSVPAYGLFLTRITYPESIIKT